MYKDQPTVSFIYGSSEVLGDSVIASEKRDSMIEEQRFFCMSYD